MGWLLYLQGLKPKFFIPSGPAKARALIRNTKKMPKPPIRWLFCLERKTMTREEILAAIVACKEKLGHIPTRAELAEHSSVRRGDIWKHFRTYGRALRACNLRAKIRRRGIELRALFEDWAQIVRKLKKIPSVGEYESLSPFSARPLRIRLGSWTKVPAGLKKLAEEQGLANEWKDVMELIAQPAKVTRGSRVRVMPDRPVYGRLIRRCAMLCQPTNEAGVMVLFGAEALRLGFMIVHVQAAYPDCQAWREVGADRLQLVNIEFEQQSRNFLRHKHDATKCDLIVCWEHNWPECPLEVIELRKLVEIG